ncbi:MAG TPA: LysE family translocator [Pseudonocardia sp.]|jgi:threonine/homoserine/homoserine lactone efflux protein|uniref:LysE family translocator n=1 Tax=Pseudonocardia sp. TaxID=60912 RepID=UPI002EDB41B3
MMLAHLLAFTAVVAVLTISPGPDVAVVVRMSLAGRARGIACGFGIVTGCFVWGVASAVGISALLTASTLLYNVLRIAGALYLCVLGVQAWRSRSSSAATAPGVPVPSVGGGMWAAFRTGLITNVLNPKVGVFYLSLLPAFVPPGVAVLPATLLLVGIHAVLGVLWLSLIATTVDRARDWLSRVRIRRVMDRITGGALVGFGVAAASEVALRP